MPNIYVVTIRCPLCKTPITALLEGNIQGTPGALLEISYAPHAYCPGPYATPELMQQAGDLAIAAARATLN